MPTQKGVCPRWCQHCSLLFNALTLFHSIPHNAQLRFLPNVILTYFLSIFCIVLCFYSFSYQLNMRQGEVQVEWIFPPGQRFLVSRPAEMFLCLPKCFLTALRNGKVLIVGAVAVAVSTALTGALPLRAGGSQLRFKRKLSLPGVVNEVLRVLEIQENSLNKTGCVEVFNRKLFPKLCYCIPSLCCNFFSFEMVSSK